LRLTALNESLKRNALNGQKLKSLISRFALRNTQLFAAVSALKRSVFYHTNPQITSTSKSK